MAYIVKVEGKFIDSNLDPITSGNYSFDTLKEANIFANSLMAPAPESIDDVVGGAIQILAN